MPETLGWNGGNHAEEPKGQPVTINFGKYKDRYVGDVPSDYLHWLIENVSLSEALRNAVLQTLDDRFASVRRLRQRISGLKI